MTRKMEMNGDWMCENVNKQVKGNQQELVNEMCKYRLHVFRESETH